jgi:hypothetical protein
MMVNTSILIYGTLKQAGTRLAMRFEVTGYSDPTATCNIVGCRSSLAGVSLLLRARKKRKTVYTNKVYRFSFPSKGRRYLYDKTTPKLVLTVCNCCPVPVRVSSGSSGFGFAHLRFGGLKKSCMFRMMHDVLCSHVAVVVSLLSCWVSCIDHIMPSESCQTM